MKFLTIIAVVVLVWCLWVYIQQWRLFKSLSEIRKGQKSTVLDILKITPSKVYINDSTVIYTFYFVSVFNIVKATERIQTYTFVAVDGVIIYISCH